MCNLKVKHLVDLSSILRFYEEESSINGVKMSILRYETLPIMVPNWSWWTSGGTKNVGSCLLYLPLEHLANLSPLLNFYEEKPSINGVKASIFRYETLYVELISRISQVHFENFQNWFETFITVMNYYFQMMLAILQTPRPILPAKIFFVVPGHDPVIFMYFELLNPNPTLVFSKIESAKG